MGKVIITPLVCLPGTPSPGHGHCPRQAGRMATKACLGSLTRCCDSGNDSVFIQVTCNIFTPSTHWFFIWLNDQTLFAKTIPFKENHPLRTLPLAQGTAEPKHLVNKSIGSDHCQDCWCHVPALILYLSHCQHCFLAQELLQWSKSGLGAGTRFSLSVCPVL